MEFKIGDLYKPEILHKGFSVFSGGAETKGVCFVADLPKTGIIRAFLEDDDIQEITVTSGNIGFSRTYTKQFKVSK